VATQASQLATHTVWWKNEEQQTTRSQAQRRPDLSGVQREGGRACARPWWGIREVDRALWRFSARNRPDRCAATGAGNPVDVMEAPTFAGMRSLREVGARRGRIDATAQPYVNTS
jgi:hypothetical protein